MFADFHFIRPFWLLALLPAALFWCLLRFYRQDSSPWQQLIAPHLQAVVLLGQQLQRTQPWAMPLLAGCWLVSVLALSGPSWQKMPQPALTVPKATVLLMDMSLSMRATDMTPDRLTQQRFKALDLIDQVKEGDLALISYAADAFVISPLTPDHNNIRLQIPTLRPELMPAQGSNVLAAIKLAGELLQQAGYPTGEVILFTDGFDHDSFHDIQQVLNNWPYRLSVLAFGQADGAVVRLENGELLKSRQGAVVVPRVPLSQLQAFAQQGGGTFLQASADNSDLQTLVNRQRDSQAKHQPQHTLSGDQWRDNAVYLVWLLLPFALWLARRAPVLVLLPALYLPTADAISLRDVWETKQQQAIKDYQQQQFDSAREKFNDPLWQGNAAYRAGHYAAAADAYRQATTRAPSAASWHNLGNALAMQQDYQAALDAYEQALTLQPDDVATQANAALMQQHLEQQRAEQQSGDEQGEDPQAAEPQNGEGDGESSANAAAEDGAQQDSAGQSEAQASDAPQQPAEQQPADAEQQGQEQQASQTEHNPDAEENATSIIEQRWPNATAEEEQALENLLRKVQDDPGILLRNRMQLEYQKRRTQPSSGARQEW